jgi:glutathione peroxidase
MRIRTKTVLKSLILAGAAGALLTAVGWSLAAPKSLDAVVKEPTTMPATAKQANEIASPLDFVVKDVDGKEQKLADYKGKVVLIVNVASKCGFTPQYAGLEELYKKYADKGFVIVGFPANNFLHQEPGTDAEIKQFCTGTYNVTFPIMSKISVLGEDKAPIYKYLTEKDTAGDFAGDITWNFNKFVIDRNGNVIARYPSQTKPQDPKLTGEIEKALNAKASGK